MKVAQRQRIRRAPGDAALRLDAFEVPDQQQLDMDARRQTGTAMVSAKKPAHCASTKSSNPYCRIS
ncbi:MAG: hypothetical protein ACM3SQ_09760 [Betaproteobacteria bacterium]